MMFSYTAAPRLVG